VKSAVSALGMFTVITSARKELPELLFQVMVEAQLLSAGDKVALSSLYPSLTKITPAITDAMNRERLATSVLPSFEGFEAVIDVRIGGGKRAGIALPVAIALIDTDAAHERLWFQMKRKDVEALIEKLTVLLKKFKTAEEWAATWPGKGEDA
jgi:hypothetical protein